MRRSFQVDSRLTLQVAFQVTTLLLAAPLLWSSCRKPALPEGTLPPSTYFLAQTLETRFHTADHFLASIEMQNSGEPFAQLLGRNLAYYDRTQPTTDLYFDPSQFKPVVDPLGYSLAIESYEYSKQPMNNTSFESGAGLSLQYGPLVNPNGSVSDDAYTLLVNRVQRFALASNTGGPAGTSWVVSPAPLDNPLNYYGWPGFWPVFLEYKSFAPDIEPAGGATHGCSFTLGYAASLFGAQTVGDYECGSNSLNLANRDHAIEKVLEPAALGFALWKQGLWVINYWQSLHDLSGNPITVVAEADLPLVGTESNQVLGHYPDPADATGKALLKGVRGTYLGDTPLEGWQGLVMLEEMDNKAAFTLGQMLTRDGATLGGFASVSEAINYDYLSPLRYWPAGIDVTESTVKPASGRSWQYFPRATKLVISAPQSRLRGLAAMAGGFGEFYALTDSSNASVGGLPGPRASFDGDPFAADNQLADGESSPHDRALGNIKIALVNIDRMHFDPAAHVMVDEATVAGGAVKRGTVVTMVDAAYAMIGLRNALRAISSSLSLYSNDTPDTHALPTALDGASLQGGAGAPGPRVIQLIAAQADFLIAHLIGADGAVANSYDLATGKADSAPTRLESEASAIRGLLDAYLATSDNRYRQAAMRVYSDLERRFWMSDVRAFRTTAGVSDTLTYTPVAFGTLQGALRQYWKLVANRPGNERVAAELLERLMRTNKLVLNGWDDANADNIVQYPAECTGASLQMAERALTGEDSHPKDKGDRDLDCVQEIAAAGLPAALAGQVQLRRR